MSKKQSDSIYHPPCGSNVPGKVEANPYVFYPPDVLRRLLESEQDEEKLEKMKSALKQWERLYRYPGYPWRAARLLRKIAHTLRRIAERPHPSINIPYYQESDIPAQPNVLHMLKPTDDNYDMPLFDYNRQGERPKRDIDTGHGGFLNPSEPPIGDTVKEKGEGPNPDIEYPFPPTGGTLDKLGGKL